MLSQPITFRHQQNPSMNGDDQDSLKSFYGYKETFAKSTTYVASIRALESAITDLHLIVGARCHLI